MHDTYGLLWKIGKPMRYRPKAGRYQDDAHGFPVSIKQPQNMPLTVNSQKGVNTVNAHGVENRVLLTWKAERRSQSSR